jgi:hypothetical protein
MSVESGLTGGRKYWLVVKLVGGVHAPYQLDNKEEEKKAKEEEKKEKKNFSVNPFKGVPT